MKNRFLKTILITLLFMTSLYAKNSPISEELEAGDLKSAMKIKKDKVNAINDIVNDNELSIELIIKIGEYTACIK